jgi:urease accessory protein
VEIGAGWVAYAHDHVLDALVRALGLEIEARVAPFEPEVGAFHTERGGHHHGDGVAHDHNHPHDHAHAPDHDEHGSDQAPGDHAQADHESHDHDEGSPQH